MSRILKLNYKQKNIAILNLESPYRISFVEGKSTVIRLENDGTYITGCINCINPRCMRLNEQEIQCPSFPSMSHDMNLNVCPVDAIRYGEHRIELIQDRCIGCGLCVQRCPIGALHIKNGKVMHNVNTNAPRKVLNVNHQNIQIQESFLETVEGMEHYGMIRKENDSIMTEIYSKIKKLSQEQQHLLTRNLLINLGGWGSLSRQGNVYMRMDGFYETVEQYGVFEVETGQDMLDVSRALLDDVAMLQTRYDIKKEQNHPLAICLGLPNKRTDYWQVVNDILKITDLQINTVTLGMLLIFLWNLEEVNDYDLFYIDANNSSLRRSAEDIMQKNINISRGHLGILENTK